MKINNQIDYYCSSVNGILMIFKNDKYNKEWVVILVGD